MKLMPMIVLLVVIQATCIVFDQVYTEEGVGAYSFESYDSDDSPIWNFIVNPGDWTNTGLFIILAGIIGVGGLIGIGTYLYTKSDTVLFFGLFTLLLGFGAIPILSLYELITRDLSLFGCSSMPCMPAILLWLFTGGIIAIAYVMACLEWWSGRSTG